MKLTYRQEALIKQFAKKHALQVGTLVWYLVSSDGHTSRAKDGIDAFANLFGVTRYQATEFYDSFKARGWGAK